MDDKELLEIRMRVEKANKYFMYIAIPQTKAIGCLITTDIPALLAEVDRLTAILQDWQSVGEAIMEAITGQKAPLSDSDVIGEVNRLRKRKRWKRQALQEQGGGAE